MRKTAAVIASLLLMGAGALACTCRPKPTVAEAYQQTKAVIFIGEVMEIGAAEVQGAPTPMKASSDLSPLADVHLRVIESFAGTKAKQLVIRTSGAGGMCGFPFESGKQYLIYASPARDGTLVTGICTRTAAVEKAGADIEYLRSQSTTVSRPK